MQYFTLIKKKICVITIKDNAKKMAELLRSGYTMLNLACPECNNPLFRNKSKEIICPICNKKVIIKKNKNLDTPAINIEKKFVNIYSIKEIVIEKIEWVAHKLNNETQINLIGKYIQILSQLFDLLIKLTNNNASAGI